MNIFLKTEDEIELMRKANRLVGATLAELAKHINWIGWRRNLSVTTEPFQRSRIFPIHLEGRFPLVSARLSIMS